MEEAIGVLSDPAAVAEAMEATRAEAARQVAQADEHAARERQACSAAQAAERDATEAANAAWERIEALEAELVAADRRGRPPGRRARPAGTTPRL